MKIQRFFVLLVSATMILSTRPAFALDISKDIFVSNAWVQAMPPSQKITAAYMTIANNSFKEIVLVSASTDIADVAEIHRMSEMSGMAHMAPMTRVQIPALTKLKLIPGGIHFMLINLKRPIKAGDVIPITLHFQDGGSVVVSATVRISEIDDSLMKPGMKM